MESAEMDQPALERLGRYRIEAELGRGAMGVVYRASDPVLDRTVALKTIALDEAGADREEFRTRFFLEAKATARLNHPALITIYDFGEEDELAYMAMELLNGTELSARLAQGPLAIADTVRLVEQVAEGLAYAHDHGVIHRDIKPSNIMLLERGRAKIMDFGIARFKQADHKTQLGTRLGTPRYMSPEQVAGGGLDHRTDIFSLGIVLYEMLTGARLFHGDDLTQVMHRVASFTPPPPSRINPQVSPLLDLIVTRALQKKAEDRYASAWEMVDDLRQCRQDGGAPAREPVAAPREASRDEGEDETGDGDGDRTQVIKPVADSVPVLRRLASQVEADQHLMLSPRYDSTEAMARLAEPAERDRRLLTRLPRRPGLLRRLRRDGHTRGLVLVVAAALLVAAAIVLS